MATLGKDTRAARVASDFYRHAIQVMQGASSIDRYESLAERNCFDVEYWPLEQYRVSLQPPEKELARRIAVVTGAASGIGRAIAQRLAAEGACVVVSDVNGDGAAAVASDLNAQHGDGRAIGVRTDVAEETDVARLFEETVAAFGGLDVLVSNAGIAPFGLLDEMDPVDWQRSLDVNATGHFLVTRHALRLFKHQGIGGNVITSPPRT
jgi:NADPH:quinone reductase-like Zn-dependent oxidoreductase